ncbi:unnamed protein product [Linum trigynum]|uniref:TF-B3 domain-containing protein n=1 Tax=Linum trigynum TaxID=586398 RepID=A0AAV2ETC1_9ROSI
MSSLGERSGKACSECSRRCSLLHGKGKKTDPCLPSFFKIMFGERFSELLFFPPKFVPMVAGFVSQGTYLKDANGGRWRVELAKVDGSLALGKGWGDFVKHHDLVLGDFVVFDLVESHFEVRMYGRTACEKLNAAQISDKKQVAHNNYGGGFGPHGFNHGGDKGSDTGKFRGQQSKVVNEKGYQESKGKKSSRIPAAQGISGTETGNKRPRNGGSARTPTAIDLETDENDEPEAASNERAGYREKAKMERGESGHVQISRNEKNKRASDVELQQPKFKWPKKEKSNDITRNRNNGLSASYSNPHQFVNGECSRDAEMGKVQTRSGKGFHKVEATAEKLLDSAAGKFQRSQVFERKLQRKDGGDQLELTVKHKTGGCGKNKVATTGKLDSGDIVERSKKLVAGFAKENLSKGFSIPSKVLELGLKAARTGKRLSGHEVDSMQMKVDSTCSRMRKTEMVPMAVLKPEPICFGSNPPTPISAQISYIIPNETRTHLDLSAPLPLLGERLSSQRTVVMLKDPKTRLWPVLYLRTSNTEVALQYGWEAFAVDHDIRVGDECIFSVDNCSEGVYAVHIIRHHVGELAG